MQIKTHFQYNRLQIVIVYTHIVVIWYILQCNIPTYIYVEGRTLVDNNRNDVIKVDLVSKLVFDFAYIICMCVYIYVYINLLPYR